LPFFLKKLGNHMGSILLSWHHRMQIFLSGVEVHWPSRPSALWVRIVRVVRVNRNIHTLTDTADRDFFWERGHPFTVWIKRNSTVDRIPRS
jgi:hypothetical protein